MTLKNIANAGMTVQYIIKCAIVKKSLNLVEKFTAKGDCCDNKNPGFFTASVSWFWGHFSVCVCPMEQTQKDYGSFPRSFSAILREHSQSSWRFKAHQKTRT
jgi:hypothetical protein